MIPKIIYYCWFGGLDKKQETIEYINSWKKILPDYQIVEINESNFDVNKYIYTKEAYAKKKYAFVSDVARVEYLYNTGGFYFDTDIRLLQTIDCFCKYKAVFGFESPSRVMTAFMGARKGNEIFRHWIEEYKDRCFETSDGIDTTTNVVFLTSFLEENYNLQLNNKTQLKDDGVIICSSSFFSPKNYETGLVEKTENTVMIHDFLGSWKDSNQLRKEKKRSQVIRLLGIKNYWKIIEIRDKLKACSRRKNI